MTAIRSASRSASSRYWVVSSSVLPPATCASIVSQSPIRLRGSRPVVGSSRKRRAGWRPGGGQVEAPAHSARVRLHDAVARVGEIEALEQVGGALTGALAAEVVEEPDHLDVFEPGQVLVDGRVLAGEADPRAQLGGVADDVEAVDAGAPAAGRQERRENPDGGGLAGAVRPQQAEHRAALDLEVDSAQGLDVLVGLAQPLRLDRIGVGSLHALHASAPRPRRWCGCPTIRAVAGVACPEVSFAPWSRSTTTSELTPAQLKITTRRCAASSTTSVTTSVRSTRSSRRCSPSSRRARDPGHPTRHHARAAEPRPAADRRRAERGLSQTTQRPNVIPNRPKAGIRTVR